MERKSDLRKLMANEKARHSTVELATLSEHILKKLEEIPAFQLSKTILLYHSLKDEVNTHLFIEKWSAYKTIVLPVVKGDELDLRYYTSSQETTIGSFGITEPQGPLLRNYDEIDLAIIPGVAFDLNNHRLGRGKGFYDRLLPQIKATKIGICFPFQLVSEIPTEANDIDMDLVLTI